MLTASKLEKIIELEDSLRAEYQTKLDAKTTEVERCQLELAEQRTQLQTTIDTQLETIADLSKKATANQKLEQQNRELFNRSENMKEEVAGQKQRIKGLQNDLAREREEIKALKQFDPAKMKKNLDANKKKLAEKTNANEILQKSLNKTKAENADLQRKIQELEDKLEELSPPTEDEEAEAEAEAEAA
jgi:septal ring factor EnvC (AmiA/AmiB activator)